MGERFSADPRAGGIFVAGLGNSLMMDDGVGVHAVRELMLQPADGIEYAEIGTAVLDALPFFERAGVVVALDAVQAGGAPGTIYELELSAEPGGGFSHSLHEFDLRALLGLLDEESRPELIVLGVEPECIDYSLELTPTVRSVLPEFIRIVKEVVGRLSSSEKRS
jgi:hydrogenase maturation protease